MIARENLEDRKQKLANHVGVLALEKLGCLERADKISEEMRQSAVLLKVFEATLTDMGADEKDAASISVSLLERIAELEDQARENGARVLDLEAEKAGEADDD